VTQEQPRTIASLSKTFLRRLIPNYVLQQRGIIQRLGPRAGHIYARFRLLDAIGARSANQRLVPPSVRSFLFVCFGNIMRSAMAESLMRQALRDAGVQEEICITSAGLHAVPGREAHAWAQTASLELGITLDSHRAKPLTESMVEQADCILTMDFQNKAELLTLYPESQDKIYMLSAYAEGSWKYRQIPDPYLGDLEATRFCARELQICIRNLVISIFPSAARIPRRESRDSQILQP